MNGQIEEKFDELGARVKVRLLSDERSRWPRLDVLRDRKGEYFDIAIPDQGSLEIIDLRPRDRHLLLLARDPGGEKAKFLCGHDERHWFVCAVPERAGVRDVASAKRALQPQAVQVRVDERRVKPLRRLRRRNDAYIRQGEWFFIRADFEPPPHEVLRNEPLSRGRGSKPHMVDFLYRRGGERVYVHERYAPAGIALEIYARLGDVVRRQSGWTQRARDPEVYAKGRVRHSDHKTVILRDWHRVFMNTEAESRASAGVVFLD